jgi:hypothetical protein
MQLKLRRDQREKMGLLGRKVMFLIDFRVELSSQEEELIKRYKAHKEIIALVPPRYYAEQASPGEAAAAMKKLNGSESFRQLTIRDFVKGKSYECDDVLLINQVEDEIKQACATFKAWLGEMSGGGREEEIEF